MRLLITFASLAMAGIGFGHAAPIPLSAGADHLLLVREDGSLWGMGADAFGQLGFPGGATQSHPLSIATGKWLKAAAGNGYSLALREDGGLWGFGRNQAGQLGKANRTVYSGPRRLGEDLWLDVAAGRDATLAVRADGSLRIWGGWEREADPHAYKHGLAGDQGLSRLAAQGKWKAVAMGADHALALRTDSTLWAIGSNGSGQTGCGRARAYDAFCPMGDPKSKWSAMAAGDGFSVGLRADGTLWTWGGNSRGEAGRGTFQARVEIGQAGTGKWAAIAAGGHHALALREDGTLWAWGEGATGALGLGDREEEKQNRNAPAQVGTETWWAIAAGGHFSAAVRADGQVMVWGDMGFATGSDAPAGKSIVWRPTAIERWQEGGAAPVNATVAEADSVPAVPAPVAIAVPPRAEPIAMLPAQATPAPVDSAPLPAAGPAHWSRTQKAWVWAGGGAVAAGAALWAFLAFSDDGGSSSPPAGLGRPPEDPVVKVSQ